MQEQEAEQQETQPRQLRRVQTAAPVKPKRRRIKVDVPKSSRRGLSAQPGRKPRAQRSQVRRRSQQKQLQVETQPQDIPHPYVPEPAQPRRNWQADKPKLFKQKQE